MVKAILAVLTLTGVLSDSSQTYIILNTIADAAFYFMPVLLAYGAAIKFDVNPILAITVAGILLHPNISQLFYWRCRFFLGIPVLAADYAGSVYRLSLLFGSCPVEPFADRIRLRLLNSLLSRCWYFNYGAFSVGCHWTVWNVAERSYSNGG